MVAAALLGLIAAALGYVGGSRLQAFASVLLTFLAFVMLIGAYGYPLYVTVRYRERPWRYVSRTLKQKLTELLDRSDAYEQHQRETAWLEKGLLAAAHEVRRRHLGLELDASESRHPRPSHGAPKSPRER
jgi:sulfite exporter TauE/SafE